ncbi:MAG: UDP-N-acetylmuramate dehydrogenase [Flavisolibacter sp.]
MKLQENISLKPYNTFGINVKAEHFAEFTSMTELEELMSVPQSIGKKLIIGGGSNLLFTKDVKGLALKNNIKGIQIIKSDNDHVYIKAGAGENWHNLVMHCVENNYAGIENLALIPGNVGASPMQNIGAYGVEIKDVFHELEAYDVKENTIRLFTLEECKFAYRESVFKNIYKDRYVIINVTFRLNKIAVFNTSYGAIKDELERMGVKDLSIKAIAQSVINIRTSKLPDPDKIGNAGSFFKNPVISVALFDSLKTGFPQVPFFPAQEGFIKLPAGWLIEQCGWKGYRKGDAGCYSKQALVLVNYGNASGKEIYDLSEEIITSVKNKFNIELEREVNIF